MLAVASVGERQRSSVLLPLTLPARPSVGGHWLLHVALVAHCSTLLALHAPLTSELHATLVVSLQSTHSKPARLNALKAHN